MVMVMETNKAVEYFFFESEFIFRKALNGHVISGFQNVWLSC